jgi:hypothetical protein
MKQDKTSAVQTQRSGAFYAISYTSVTFCYKYQLSITTNQSTLRNIPEERISQTLYLNDRWSVCSAPRLGRITPMERDIATIVQEAGWAPRPVWTDAENLAPTGIRFPNRPYRSKPVYRLSYPGQQKKRKMIQPERS